VFKPGDHIQVWRRGIYWHHGIYVSDDRVIEFGGGSLWDKQSAVVRPVTLATFENTGTAVVVPHPRRFLLGLGMGLPDPLPRDEIVARAEWLIGKCPKGRYNLVGSNCEHVANWCITGGYFESLQARRLFMVHAYVGLALTLGWRLSGYKSVWLKLMLANSVWGPIGPFLYHTVPYRKWRDILVQWPGYEPQGPDSEGDNAADL
jgi:hypothetical protein